MASDWKSQTVEIYNILPSVRRWCPCSHSERMISITRRTIQRVHWSGVFKRRSSNGQVSPYRFSMVEGCLIIRLVYCHLEHLWLQLVSNGFTSLIKYTLVLTNLHISRQTILIYGFIAHTHTHTCTVLVMMTSSNGNIFRVTGHLCREFTGDRWIPRTKVSDAQLWCFIWYASE